MSIRDGLDDAKPQAVSVGLADRLAADPVKRTEQELLARPQEER